MGRFATATAILAGAGLLYFGFMKMTTPRGIRNNNPGNIEKGVEWNGMAAEQGDSRYITFETPEYGIRAMARILRTYREQHGIYSVAGIINRWAPPVENPTAKYIEFVSGQVGVAPHAVLDFSDVQVAALLAAIIRFENGVQPYDSATILAGIEMERN